MNNISFCIPTNGKRTEITLALIKSIREQEWDSNLFEIIICGDIDNFKNEQNIILIDKKIESHTKKVAVLRNAAADASKYENIAFCDDDIILEKDWLKNYISYSNNNEWELLSNKVILPNGTRYWDRCTISPHKLVDYNHPGTDKAIYQSSAFFLVKKEIFKKVRWDETKLIFADKTGGIPEDVQYSFDLHKLNINFKFNNKCLVWHADDRYTQYGSLTLFKQTIKDEYKKIGEEPPIPKTCEEFKKIISKYNLNTFNTKIKSKDLVSIVVPTYNDSEYIKDCIDDLLNQTYENIEIIIVNDGSTDDTSEILKDLSLKYNNITVYNKKNGGTGSALNEGFKHTKGKYLTWVSSDDRKTYDMIEKLVKPLQDNPDVRYSVSSFYESGYKKIFRVFKPSNDDKGYVQNFNFLDNFYSGKTFIVDEWVDANSKHCLSGVNFMFTRTLKEECGDFLEQPGEDYYMSIMMGMKSRVAYIDEPLGSHLLRDNSLSITDPTCFVPVNDKIKHYIQTNYKKWQLKNIPKIANFYWGSDKLSFMRYMTILSFKKLNPDWSIHLYVPKSINFGKTWVENISLDNKEYDGHDYFEQIKSLSSVKIIKVDFSNTNVSAGSEPHRSDYLRWSLLSSVGGFWFDMDILFVKPITDIYFNQEKYAGVDTLVSYDERHHSTIGTNEMSIGVLMSSKNNKFYRKILSQAKLENNFKNYQSLGTNLFDKCNLNNLNYNASFPDLNFHNLDYNCFYAKDYINIADIYEKDCLNDLLKLNHFIGIHWYGGAELTKKFNNLINHINYKDFNNTICRAIDKIQG